MDSSSLIIVLALLGYLIGSIPFGVVVSRFLGAPDPRTAGSHNVGFTNVLRVSGKKAGILTLLGDIGKGWLVAWIGTLVLSQESSILFVALAPIIGLLALGMLVGAGLGAAGERSIYWKFAFKEGFLGFIKTTTAN